MSNIEEPEVMVAEAASNEKESSAASRWIEDSPKPAEKKKKGPFIQVSVIISLCLVVFSLLAFFAYKIFFIAEPEGVVWVWSAEGEDINWYYEFKEDNVFKAYVGSFEITATYNKDKSDDEVNKLTVSSNANEVQQLGCFFLNYGIEYSISGSRLSGDQEMTMTYTDDPEKNEYVLKQTDELPEPLELPEDFKEDKQLTGEWINTLSGQFEKQTITFNDDGSMYIILTYTGTDGSVTEVKRNCTYTVSDNELTITYKTGITNVHPADYLIKDGILYFDQMQFRRVDDTATPDQG